MPYDRNYYKKLFHIFLVLWIIAVVVIAIVMIRSYGLCLIPLLPYQNMPHVNDNKK
jgi:hypothetical protein